MQEQRLAAILFSDIAGYSRMMGSDQARTLELVKDASEFHKACIEKHHGFLHKEMGDGFMATFPSASDACNCASDLIGESHARENLQLHIGIHLGEVTFKDGDIFGDGVNIAARVQAQAKTDQVLLTEPVYLNLKNNRNFQMEYLDEVPLKNISENYRLYELVIGKKASKKIIRRKTRKRIWIGSLFLIALIASILAFNNLFSVSFRGDQEIKIAVLPFQDLSDNASNFSEGLCYEIRSKLSSVKGLQVASAQSSLTARTLQLSLEEIGRVLKITHILEGSIQIFDDQIHFNLFLTNVKSDESVPIKLNDYPLADLNSAQVKIALEVADWLDHSLTASEEQSVMKVPTENAEAYRHYLLGLPELNKGTAKNNLIAAEARFKQAIALDSTFAKAYVSLAETYNLWGMYGYMDNRESARFARKYAEKALELDPHSSNAHIAMAIIYFQERMPEEALKELDLAIEEDPESEEAYFQKFRIYIYWNDMNSAREMIDKTYALNPLNVLYKVDQILVKPEKIETTIKELEEVIEKDPTNYYAKWQLGLRYSLAGDYEKAENILRSRSVDSLENNWYLGYVFAKLGKTEQARRILEYQIGKSDTVFVPPSMIALIHWGLDEKEEAYHWMQKAYEVHDNFPFMLPAFDVMESEPWFDEYFYLGTVDNPRNPYEGLRD